MSCFLYYRPGMALLVDCGNRGSEDQILAAMKAVGLVPGDLKWLILTHAHLDHAGSAARLKEITGCRILVHRLEAPRLQKGRTPFPRGTRWKARILIGLGRLFMPRYMRYPPVEPDMEVKGDTDLEHMGFPARLVHCPGHTPGSLLLLTPQGDLLAGDSLFGLEGKQHFPPFAEDLPALVKSWKRIRELDFHTAWPAHGRPVSRESFMAEFKGAMARYS
jgi:glyoxylase-like metal-dependent hydrolase (beta-lactamase superfamily II)